MATYSYDNFIKIPVPGDKKLEIYDSNGNIQYMLEPLDVNFFYRNNKVVVHQMRTRIEREPSRDHSYAELDFDSVAIAQQAELKANDCKNLILGFTEYYTTTEIDNMIETIETQISGITSALTSVTFLELQDTPDSYNDLTGYTLTVNSAGTGIDFTDNNYTITYSNSSATLIAVGGVESNSIFQNQSMKDMWDNLLYPELMPAFTSFVVAGMSNMEVGNSTTSGNTSFSWTLRYPTLFEDNTLRIYDSASHYMVYNTGLTSPQSYFLSGVTKNVKTYHYWAVIARKIGTPTFVGRIHRIDWFWRTFYGSTSQILTSATTYTDLMNLGGDFTSILTELIAGSNVNYVYNFSSPGYKYFIIPTTSGYYNTNGVLVTKVPDSFTDRVTRLGVAMAGPSDGYNDGNNSGSYYYKNLSLTNNFGQTTTYRMYRTKYQLGGDPINIIVY